MSDNLLRESYSVTYIYVLTFKNANVAFAEANFDMQKCFEGAPSSVCVSIFFHCVHLITLRTVTHPL